MKASELPHYNFGASGQTAQSPTVKAPSEIPQAPTLVPADAWQLLTDARLKAERLELAARRAVYWLNLKHNTTAKDILREALK